MNHKNPNLKCPNCQTEFPHGLQRCLKPECRTFFHYSGNGDAMRVEKRQHPLHCPQRAEVLAEVIVYAQPALSAATTGVTLAKGTRTVVEAFIGADAAWYKIAGGYVPCDSIGLRGTMKTYRVKSGVDALELYARATADPKGEYVDGIKCGDTFPGIDVRNRMVLVNMNIAMWVPLDILEEVEAKKHNGRDDKRHGNRRDEKRDPKPEPQKVVVVASPKPAPAAVVPATEDETDGDNPVLSQADVELLLAGKGKKERKGKKGKGEETEGDDEREGGRRRRK